MQPRVLDRSRRIARGGERAHQPDRHARAVRVAFGKSPPGPHGSIPIPSSLFLFRYAFNGALIPVGKPAPLTFQPVVKIRGVANVKALQQLTSIQI
jgi:hypothetical protein